MFCPQCGQRQAAHEVRFCSSCGFPLNVVGELLANGGQLSWRPADSPAARNLSPRQKGIRQGAMWMLSSMLVLPLVVFISIFITGSPELFIPAAAVICFVGGLLRIFYALLLEETAAQESLPAAGPQTYVPPAAPPNYLGHSERALPHAQSAPVPAPRRARFDTGEIPSTSSSVTDHTTRLLDKQTEEPQEK